MPQTRPKATQKSIKPIIRALQGCVDARVPFWFMRQAGRYLPEYRILRQKAGSFLNLCFTPEMAAEVTLQPLRRFDMDAAILFSDILVIPLALGQELDFVEGEGPKLGPLDIDKLTYSETKIEPIYETLKIVRSQLEPKKTLIGFAGAPWTVACYMVEGQGTGHFSKTLAFAKENEEVFDRLINKVADATVRYLSSQIQSGAEALQIFDSWAGLLPADKFQRWVIDPTKRIRSALKHSFPEIPVIGFPRGAQGLYADYAHETCMDCIGLDTGVSMEWVAREIPPIFSLQGNLDPALLLEGGKKMEEETRTLLEKTQGRAFVFNLGHGIIKETPPENVAHLSDILRNYSR